MEDKPAIPPFRELLSGYRERGEFVADEFCTSCAGPDDTLQATHELFDRIAWSHIDRVRTLIRGLAPGAISIMSVSQVEEEIVCLVVRTFQGQIFYLRDEIKRQAAARLYWANPQRLMENPKLLKCFDEWLVEHHPQQRERVLATLSLALPAERK